jgi:hypothetical protein
MSAARSDSCVIQKNYIPVQQTAFFGTLFVRHKIWLSLWHYNVFNPWPSWSTPPPLAYIEALHMNFCVALLIIIVIINQLMQRVYYGPRALVIDPNYSFPHAEIPVNGRCWKRVIDG